MYLKSAIPSLMLIAVSSLSADVTLRYQTEVKLNPNLPAAMQGMNAIDAAVPRETVSQFKGGKGIASQGAMTSISDFSKQEVTILDKEGKRYATLPFAQFGDAAAAAMPHIPDQAAAMMASMKTHSESRATGRTATIQGIDAEERDVEITVDAPALPNMPAMPGPMMRMVMHLWTAKRDEIARVPAIRELVGYNLFAAATMNPLGSLEKMLRQMPLVGDISRLLTETQSAGTPVMLRMQVEMFMPMMGAVMKQMPAGASPFGENFDASAPLMTMNQELASISSETIPDAVFRVPDGYQSAPAADILREIMNKASAAAKK